MQINEERKKSCSRKLYKGSKRRSSSPPRGSPRAASNPADTSTNCGSYWYAIGITTCSIADMYSASPIPLCEWNFEIRNTIQMFLSLATNNYQSSGTAQFKDGGQLSSWVWHFHERKRLKKNWAIFFLNSQTGGCQALWLVENLWKKLSLLWGDFCVYC